MHKQNEVIMVLYDLPCDGPEERRCAVRFRKNLLKNGYISFQKSVYVKLLKTKSTKRQEMMYVQNIAPEAGNVNALCIPLSLFRNMYSIQGSSFNMSVFSDELLIV